LRDNKNDEREEPDVEGHEHEARKSRDELVWPEVEDNRKQEETCETDCVTAFATPAIFYLCIGGPYWFGYSCFDHVWSIRLSPIEHFPISRNIFPILRFPTSSGNAFVIERVRVFR
jgi:hypothetical protein